MKSQGTVRWARTRSAKLDDNAPRNATRSIAISFQLARRRPRGNYRILRKAVPARNSPGRNSLDSAGREPGLLRRQGGWMEGTDPPRARRTGRAAPHTAGILVWHTSSRPRPAPFADTL